MYDLEIIIPVYNEGRIVNNVYQHLCSALGEQIKWRVSFIYDFDEDTTIPFIRGFQKNDDRVFALKQNFGKGVVNALKFGFSQCHNGAVAVVMGDDSDDLESLTRMLEVYKEKRPLVVASSRYSKGGRYEGGEFLKKYFSMFAGFILNLLGVGTKDPTNNFKLYNGDFLKKISPESVGGFEVALELTVKAALKGRGKVLEVPGIWRDRVDGESKFQLFRWLPFYVKWFFFFITEKYFFFWRKKLV